MNTVLRYDDSADEWRLWSSRSPPTWSGDKFHTSPDDQVSTWSGTRVEGRR